MKRDAKHIIIRIIKLAAAVFLLPAIVFSVAPLSVAVFYSLVNFRPAFFFALGCAVYGFIHAKIFNFSRIYVIEHEFTHALAALFFGYKVHSIKIKEDSGDVKLSDYNTAVVLAPYIIPLYFLCAVPVCAVMYHNGLSSIWWKYFYAFALGFIWFFHIVHTVRTIVSAEQPDLKFAGGKVFSVSLILLFNILFLLVVTALAFPGNIDVWGILKDIFWSTLNFWQKLVHYLWTTLLDIFRL